MYPSPVATLAATILAATPDQQRQMWSNAARSNAATQNPFRNHAGGPQNLIEVRSEAKQGKMGDTVNFATHNEYFNEGITGDTPFTTQDDYEKDELSNSRVKVGLVKNGSSNSAYNAQTLPEEILGNVPQKLGRWMGRKEYEDAAMTHLHTCHATSRMVLGKTHPDDLTSLSELSYDSILDMAGWLQPMGGTPLNMKRDKNGSVVNGYLVLATTPAWTALKADDDVKSMHKEAMQRSEQNPVFTGELSMLDGNIIQHFQPINHTMAGPIGSPYAPQAILGEAITAGTATFQIKGGRTAADKDKYRARYFRWFPHLSGDNALSNGVALLAGDRRYQFANGNRLVPGTDLWGSYYGTTRFYVTIVNPRGSSDGKWAIYEVTANNGNELTVGKRLRASGSNGGGADISYGTVGSVTYNGTYNSLDHPVGSLVYLSNNKGLPLCVTPMFGASAMRMGKGIWDNYRHQDPPAQGMYNYLYNYSVFGHACTQDFGGQTPGILNMVHTYRLAGWNIPTV